MSTLQLILGGGSGLIVSLIFQPFQILKVALIVNSNPSLSSFQRLKFSFHQIIKQQGPKGFWKGLIPTALRSTSGSAIYFAVLRFLQRIQQKKSRLYDGINSGMARIINSILLNPLTILQIRSQIPGYNPYKGLYDAVFSIAKHQGIHSFKIGIVPVIWKQGVFAAIFYPLYKNIKDLKVHALLAGIIAGLIATAASHPFQVTRARIQSGMKGNLSMKSQLKNIIRQQSWYGLWRGIGPRLLKKPAVNTMTFLLYQLAQKRFKSKLN